MGVFLKVSSNGRIMIPADVRKRLGLQPGSELLLEEGEHGLTMTTPQQRLLKARALARKFYEGKTVTSVDDFIAEKRREVAAGLA